MWLSMTEGDYRLILYPLDYQGNLCGTDYGKVDMTEFPYLYYVNDFAGGVCVKECPAIEEKVDPYTLLTYGGLYQPSDRSIVTSDQISIADYSNTNNTLVCTQELCYPDPSDPKTAYTSYGVNKGQGFAWFALDTYEVLWRCVVRDDAKEALYEIVKTNETENSTSPTDLANQIIPENQVTQAVKGGYNFWSNLYGDLWMARYYILGLGFGASLILGFLYSFALRIPGVLAFMVWASIFLTVAIFFIAGWYASEMASQWATADPPTYTQQEINAATYASYALYAVGGLLVLLFLFMRKRIQLAMGCVKETSKAIITMPIIILFPVIQALGFMVFMIIWSVYAANLASMGEFSTNSFQAGPISVSQCAWYLLFCFFWTGQFILAMGEIVFAMAVSKWYFSRDKDEIGNLTVVSSITTSIWYHSGTAAFGSLIIAIIQMIRSFLAYLQRKAEEMDSSLAKAVLCCFQCCFWCLEKCMKFLNKNAYIQTAIFGTAFCTSAREAFFLILRNAVRIAAITYVSGGVMFVGKVFITTITTGMAYIAISQQIGDELYSIIGPLVFIAAIAWFIAGMFMGVYDMGIATILQCFVADEEMFDEDQMYAEGDLKSWVDSHG
ncbi:hypothetical protein HJC23_004785 [Cyclotella cryptica]|uniref:Choline transporter-like protein n=1 Tax=Cyclotella cryptica TaxID=29204 RepID=A0ABD3PXY4_9STRA